MAIENLQGLHFSGGVKDSAIHDAENQLGLKFASDYISYLKRYGQVEANGIELTGLSDKVTTSVVNATNLLRKLADIPHNMYVIEDLEIDGIEYLQDDSGKIYQYTGNKSISLYAQSLAEYIETSIKSNYE